MSTTLYWYWTTNPQKIRLALEDWQIPHDLIQVHLGKGDNRSPEYRRLHPKGSVPTLVFQDKVYWESNAALLALANVHTDMLPSPSSADYAEALNLLFMEACTFQRWAGVHYIEQKINPLIGKSTNPDALVEAHQRLQSSFDILERRLAERETLFDAFSVVDCAFAPWLPYLDLSERPNMQRWLAHLRTRDSWNACGFRD
jgi:glutathione S-transferase